MMRIEILSGSTVINTIIASESEAERLYPGTWRIADVQPSPVPETISKCTPAQGLIALYALKGITKEEISSLIDLIPDDENNTRYLVKTAFNHATQWQKESQSMLMMSAILQLTQEDLDNLFEYASKVEV